MRWLLLALVSIVLLQLVGTLWAADPPAPPATPKKPVTDEYHGVKVTDNYRWLDNMEDPAVKQWIEAQNKYSRGQLDQSKALPKLRKRLKELMSAETASFTGLHFQHGTLFGLKKQPPSEQPFLVTLKSVDEPDSAKVLVDPNKLDSKGKTAIDFYAPSRSAKYVAVSLSEGGSEEGTAHVFEVATGKKLGDVIPRVGFPTAGGDLVWDEQDTGFYYTRYPAPNERPKTDLQFYQQIYHHKLGDDPAKDEFVLGKDFPRIGENFLDTSADGKYLLVTTQNGDGGDFMHHLRGPDGKWIQLSKFEDQISAPAFGAAGDAVALSLSRKNAPLGKILRLPLDKPDLKNATVFVPEGKVAIDALRFASNRLVTGFTPTATGVYVADVDGGPSRLRFVTRDGKSTVVALPPVPAVQDIVPVEGDTVLVQIETFLQPRTWYIYPKNGAMKETKLASTSPADFSDCEVLREFATSRDGTKVPMSIVRKKGVKLDGTNPTLLTGYGGYGVSQTPRFRAASRLWLEQGGVFVVANVRGGAEYGEDWHKAGNLTNKQNVFDDFAACANQSDRPAIHLARQTRHRRRQQRRPSHGRGADATSRSVPGGGHARRHLRHAPRRASPQRCFQCDGVRLRQKLRTIQISHGVFAAP